MVKKYMEGYAESFSPLSLKPLGPMIMRGNKESIDVNMRKQEKYGGEDGTEHVRHRHSSLPS